MLRKPRQATKGLIEVHAYLLPDAYGWLRQEAFTQGISQSALIGHLIHAAQIMAKARMAEVHAIDTSKSRYDPDNLEIRHP